VALAWRPRNRGSQLAATSLSFQRLVVPPPFARRRPGDYPVAFCLLLSAFCLPNGGFVPDSGKARSFVINQLGGFVFQKALSFQLSAVSYQQREVERRRLRVGKPRQTFSTVLTLDSQLSSSAVCHPNKVAVNPWVRFPYFGFGLKVIINR